MRKFLIAVAVVLPMLTSASMAHAHLVCQKVKGERVCAFDNHKH